MDGWMGRFALSINIHIFYLFKASTLWYSTLLLELLRKAYTRTGEWLKRTTSVNTPLPQRRINLHHQNMISTSYGYGNNDCLDQSLTNSRHSLCNTKFCCSDSGRVTEPHFLALASFWISNLPSMLHSRLAVRWQTGGKNSLGCTATSTAEEQNFSATAAAANNFPPRRWQSCSVAQESAFSLTKVAAPSLHASMRCWLRKYLRSHSLKVVCLTSDQNLRTPSSVHLYGPLSSHSFMAWLYPSRCEELCWASTPSSSSPLWDVDVATMR